jgi:hypothetical protein
MSESRLPVPTEGSRMEPLVFRKEVIMKEISVGVKISDL